MSSLSEHLIAFKEKELYLEEISVEKEVRMENTPVNLKTFEMYLFSYLQYHVGSLSLGAGVENTSVNLVTIESYWFRRK